MAELRFPNEGSIPEFLAALASPEGTHGAVSAAAVAGAMGASLLQMVATLPQTLPEGDDDRTALASAVAALVRMQEELLETIETETAVKLFAARNMPQGGEAERARREDAIQLALRAAADVPLEVMRLCAQRAAARGHPGRPQPACRIRRCGAGGRAARGRLQRRALQPRGQAAEPH